MSQPPPEPSVADSGFSFDQEVIGRIRIELSVPARVKTNGQVKRVILTHVFKVPSYERFIDVYQRHCFKVVDGDLTYRETEDAILAVWKEFIDKKGAVLSDGVRQGPEKTAPRFHGDQGPD